MYVVQPNSLPFQSLELSLPGIEAGSVLIHQLIERVLACGKHQPQIVPSLPQANRKVKLKDQTTFSMSGIEALGVLASIAQ
jgi:hypothetical protein